MDQRPVKVYRVLGTKSGFFDGGIVAAIVLSGLPGVLLQSFLLALCFPVFVLFGSIAGKKYFGDRDDWFPILLRLLVAPKGGWNLNEADDNNIRQATTPGD